MEKKQEKATSAEAAKSTSAPSEAPPSTESVTPKTPVLPELPAAKSSKLAPLTEPSSPDPKVTKFAFTIKNKRPLIRSGKAAFTGLANRKPTTTSITSDWYDRLALPAYVETDRGDRFTIDVQPDFRFPFSYIQYCTRTEFPELDTQQFPYVSTFSLIAYQQILFGGYLLGNDLYNRGRKSPNAQSFINDVDHRDYLDQLLSLHVPAYLADVLGQLAAVLDPRRTDLEFVPCLASAKWAHDYGRLMPPQLMLIAHNLVSRARADVLLPELLRQFYNTLVITVNTRPYLVTHFIGGYFAQAANAAPLLQHQNWLNQMVEDLFLPFAGLTRSQKPTLSPIQLTAQEVPNQCPNFYELLTCLTTVDASSTRQFLTNVSSYIEMKSSGSIPLGAVLSRQSGIIALSHTIEPVTLPTWHFDFPPNRPVVEFPNNQTHQQYATRTHFLSTVAVYAGTIPVPDIAPAEWRRNLYAVQEFNHANQAPPYTFMLFNSRQTVTPHVLLLTPYDKGYQQSSVAVTLGLKIEAEEFDSVHIPLANPRSSLNDNNSFFVQGSLHQRLISPVTLSTAEAHRVRIVVRQNQTTLNENVGFSIRNGSRNIVPIFDNANVQPNINAFFGLTTELHHFELGRGFTQSSWLHSYAPQASRRTRYLWSSYRHTDNGRECNARNIYMYYSIRHFFGTNELLALTRNPSDLVSVA